MNSIHFQDIKQTVRQRLEYIEIMAYYTGVISRSDLSRTFGISDAAATKTLKQYNDLLPDNLIYQHNNFGFSPTTQFEAIFADLSPQTVLPMIATNLAIMAKTVEEQPIYGIQVENLPRPLRLPNKSIIAQIIQAIKHKQKVRIAYSSMTDSENRESRIIEPHSIVDSGLRWHIRAYNERSYDFRDFVLPRISQATRLKIAAESSAIYDDDWTETTQLILTPHPNLSTAQQQGLLIDYDAVKTGVIELTVRRALAGYVLQNLSVDTSKQHSMNPNAYQLILLNQEEVSSFASWSFL